MNAFKDLKSSNLLQHLVSSIVPVETFTTDILREAETDRRAVLLDFSYSSGLPGLDLQPRRQKWPPTLPRSRSAGEICLERETAIGVQPERIMYLARNDNDSARATDNAETGLPAVSVAPPSWRR